MAASLGEAILRIRADSKQAIGSLEKVGSKMNYLGRQIQQVGVQGAFMGAAAAGGLSFAMKQGVDFEHAMSSVQAKTQATGDQFRQLSEEAVRLGETTMFSGEQAAKGMNFLAMAGLEVNDILKTTEDTLRLAQVGGLQMAEAADIASNVMTGMQLEAGELSRVVDIMAQAASSANTNIKELGNAFAYAAPIAGTTGQTAEEVAAAISTLANAGIKGSRAGRGLSRIMELLAKGGKDVREVAKELGISMEELNPSANSLSDILNTLAEAGITTRQIFKMFNSSAGRMVSILVSNIEGFNKLSDTMSNAQGRAEDMADTMTRNVWSNFVRIMSKLSTISIKIFQLMQEDIVKTQKVIESFLKNIIEWIDKNEKLAKSITTTAIKMSSWTIAISLSIIMLGLLLRSIGITLVSLSYLGKAFLFAFSPVGALVMPLIALLGYLALKIYQNREAIKEWVKSSNLLGKFGKVLNRLGNLFDFVTLKIKQIIDWFWELITLVFPSLRKNAGTLEEAFTKPLKAIYDALGWIGDQASEALNSFQQTLSDNRHKILNIIDDIRWFFIDARETIRGVWEQLSSIVASATNTIIQYLKPFWNLMKIVFWGIVDGVKAFGSSVSDNFDSIKEAGNSLWNSLGNLFGAFRKIVTSLVGANKEGVTFSGVMKKVGSFLGDVFSKALTRVLQGLSWLINSLAQATNVMRKFIESGKAQETFIQTWNKIKSVFNSVMKELQPVFDFFKVVFNALKSSVLTYWEVVQSYMPQIKKAFKRLWNAVKGLKEPFQRLFEAFTKAGKQGVTFKEVAKTLAGVLGNVWMVAFTSAIKILGAFIRGIGWLIKRIAIGIKKIADIPKVIEAMRNQMKARWDALTSYLMTQMLKVWHSLMKEASEAWGFVFDLLKKAKQLWDWLLEGVNVVWNKIVGGIKWVGEKIKSGFKVAIDFVGNLWNGFLNFVAGLPETIGKAVSKIGSILKDKIGGVFESLKDKADDLKNKILDVLGWGEEAEKKASKAAGGTKSGAEVAGDSLTKKEAKAETATGNAGSGSPPENGGGETTKNQTVNDNRKVDVKVENKYDAEEVGRQAREAMKEDKRAAGGV